MAVIGTFTPAKDGGWVGRIHTLTVNARVRLVPNDDRTSRKAPAFRVYVGNSRIGEAWEARTAGLSPKDYLRVIIDDPLFSEPLTGALFRMEDKECSQLLWSRRRVPRNSRE